jgi:cytochrome b
MGKQRIRLWDLPTRFFHWSLVILVLASFVSGKLGGNAMNWHGKFGLAILGLLTFRVVWGIVGSSYARFAQFFSNARVSPRLPPRSMAGRGPQPGRLIVGLRTSDLAWLSGRHRPFQQ